ncbi:MAG: carbon monoxide dehydrogenase [Chloroflexota bacterium]|nr:carbon monoxide dehydrogenase [Chloroflexota bacterium]
MAVFDAYIKKINDYKDDLRDKGRLIRTYDCPSSVGDLLNGLPVRVGPNAGSGLVLRSDTFVELGNPDTGSSSFLLWTDNPGLINNGRITLIGPDIPESQGQSLPFGQIIIVGGTGIDEIEHEALDRTKYISDRVEGYMVKSLPRQTWCRVSNEAAEKGFNFEALGRAIMGIFKGSVEKIEAMETIFVTSSIEDIQVLDSINEQVREMSGLIIKETWSAKGYDIECFSTVDCDACEYREVCDEVKDIVKVRKVIKKSDGGPET